MKTNFNKIFRRSNWSWGKTNTTRYVQKNLTNSKKNAIKSSAYLTKKSKMIEITGLMMLRKISTLTNSKVTYTKTWSNKTCRKKNKLSKSRKFWETVWISVRVMQNTSRWSTSPRSMKPSRRNCKRGLNVLDIRLRSRSSIRQECVWDELTVEINVLLQLDLPARMVWIRRRTQRYRIWKLNWISYLRARMVERTCPQTTRYRKRSWFRILQLRNLLCHHYQ